jgi:2-iminoacetate synthase ThiH
MVNKFEPETNGFKLSEMNFMPNIKIGGINNAEGLMNLKNKGIDIFMNGLEQIDYKKLRKYIKIYFLAR